MICVAPLIDRLPHHIINLTLNLRLLINFLIFGLGFSLLTLKEILAELINGLCDGIIFQAERFKYIIKLIVTEQILIHGVN